ncbi:hypothetical protein J4466_01435 [Candidatus Pacearchaeota archaeon]|nr:hypothetical protein [Candidatus Pacearchaeota archaeon]
MEIYRLFNNNYVTGRVFYSPESEGGRSYYNNREVPTVLGRTLSASWSRGVRERLEEATKRPSDLKRQYYGGTKDTEEVIIAKLFKRPRE